MVTEASSSFLSFLPSRRSSQTVRGQTSELQRLVFRRDSCFGHSLLCRMMNMAAAASSSFLSSNLPDAQARRSKSTTFAIQVLSSNLPDTQARRSRHSSQTVKKHYPRNPCVQTRLIFRPLPFLQDGWHGRRGRLLLSCLLTFPTVGQKGQLNLKLCLQTRLMFRPLPYCAG